MSYKRTEEHIRRISALNKGKKLSVETRKKISLNSARKGKPAWNRGIKFSEETRKKMSEFRLGRFIGEKNPMWKGGLSKRDIHSLNNPQYKSWRNSIFKRDGWKCSRPEDPPPADSVKRTRLEAIELFEVDSRAHPPFLYWRFFDYE